MSVRKAHNNGRNHLRNVVDYYQQIGHEKAQSVIDSITSSYAAEGQANPLLGTHPPGAGIPGMPGAPGYPPPPPFGFPGLPSGRPGALPPPAFGMPLPPVSGSGSLPPPNGRGAPNLPPFPFPQGGMPPASSVQGIPPPFPGAMPFPPPGAPGAPAFQFPPPSTRSPGSGAQQQSGDYQTPLGPPGMANRDKERK